MGDHYIPRKYLKGFTEAPDSDFIFCFVKNESRFYKVNIIRIAQENNLNLPSVEQYLSNDIEDPCKLIFDKIAEKTNLDENEKLCFAKYIVLLIMRNPERIDISGEWLNNDGKGGKI